MISNSTLGLTKYILGNAKAKIKLWPVIYITPTLPSSVTHMSNRSSTTEELSKVFWIPQWCYNPYISIPKNYLPSFPFSHNYNDFTFLDKFLGIKKCIPRNKWRNWSTPHIVLTFYTCWQLYLWQSTCIVIFGRLFHPYIWQVHPLW